MECKNCGKEIIKIVDRWYHKDTSRWFCNTKHAEPKPKKKRKIRRLNWERMITTIRRTLILMGMVFLIAIIAKWWGYGFYSVVGGSMCPARGLFGVGISKETNFYDNLIYGDIYIFNDFAESDHFIIFRKGRLVGVNHRLINKTEDGDYLFCGDNNGDYCETVGRKQIIKKEMFYLQIVPCI